MSIYPSGPACQTINFETENKFLKITITALREKMEDLKIKQEDNIRYQARDLAIVKAQIDKLPILLSSATPSFETYKNIEKKKFTHLYQPSQYSGLELPNIELVNLQKAHSFKNNSSQYLTGKGETIYISDSALNNNHDSFSGKTGTSQVKKITIEERESEDFRKKDIERKNQDQA